MSDAEEKEYLKGEVRKRDKRIKSLEKEVGRLTKYLMRDDWDFDWDEKESKVKSPKKWKCSKCGFDRFDQIELPQGDIIKRYVTCKGCGHRTGSKVNVKDMGTKRK